MILLAAALAYTLLVVELRRVPGQSATVMAASGSDRKGIVSVALYVVAIPVSLVLGLAWLSIVLYAAVAAIWFIPDRRIEHVLGR